MHMSAIVHRNPALERLPGGMRFPIAVSALLLLASFAPSPGPVSAMAAARLAIAFDALPLDPSNPARRRVGGLVYLGGWAMRGDDPRFGGISAMHVDKKRVTALTDAGSLIRFAVPGARSGKGSIEALRDGPGNPDKKSDRDAESMAIYGGQAWIAFEKTNAVWRYRGADWRSDAHASPPAMRKWPSNAGSEAMLRLPDGRFLIFSEGKKRGDGSTEALLFDGDPARAGTKASSLGYRAPAGFSITDAALLPDGRILFLNRRFALLEGVAAKLTVGHLSAVKAGAVLTGREIATLRPPLTVDNMEAMSVAREGEKTIVWIASDDNFNGLQRNLLMKFTLAE